MVTFVKPGCATSYLLTILNASGVNIDLPVTIVDQQEIAPCFIHLTMDPRCGFIHLLQVAPDAKTDDERIAFFSSNVTFGGFMDGDPISAFDTGIRIN